MEIKYTTHYAPFPEAEQPRTRIVSDRAPAAALGDPYRDVSGSLQLVSQHLSIAYDLASELVTYEREFRRAIQINAAERAAATCVEFSPRWENLWLQLEDGRRIASAAGRDVSRYESARDAAKDLSAGAAFVDVGEWRPNGFNAYQRKVTYRMPSLDPAIEAIAALQAAVPEAAINVQTEVPDLSPKRLIPWKWIVIVLVVVIVVAIGVHEWHLVHSHAF